MDTPCFIAAAADISSHISLTSEEHSAPIELCRSSHLLDQEDYTHFPRYIFTDLAPAGDLFSYVDSQNGFLFDWESRFISYQVLQAIHYLHSKDIVHRDIKPENVLLTRRDSGARVVLTDFGFANYVGSTGRLMSKLGTRGYAAP